MLAWAAGRFAPRITFATAFGAEGCVLVDLIARNHLPVDVFTLDTGLLFPETYALWRRLEERYGLTIRAVRPDLSVEGQAAVHGAALWERMPDRCCEIRKVAPLRRALSGFDAWITSIRRDQTTDRSVARVVERDLQFGLVKVNPLAGWTGGPVSVSIPSGASQVGVVIALCSNTATCGPSKGTGWLTSGTVAAVCGQLYVQCWNNGSSGLDFIQGYSTTGVGTSIAPILRSVTLTSGNCTDNSAPYFLLNGGCKLGVYQPRHARPEPMK